MEILSGPFETILKQVGWLYDDLCIVSLLSRFDFAYEAILKYRRRNSATRYSESLTYAQCLLGVGTIIVS